MVRRKGFVLVPDFAGTAHAYCGSTLEQAKGDLLAWDGLPTMDAMLRAYIIRSRVRTVENFLLVRPYSPALFQQGNLPGPSLLLEAQRGKLNEAELKKAWKAAEKEEESRKEERKNWPWSMQLPCRMCTIQNNNVEKRYPLSAFVTDMTLPAGWRAISRGYDLCCYPCASKRLSEGMKTTAMLCQSCMKVLRSRDFPVDEQLAWKNANDGPFMCHTCAGRRVHRADITLYFCNGACKRRWPEGAFDADQLRAWERNKETGAMKCIRCTAQDENDKRLDLQHHCSQCKKEALARICSHRTKDTPA